MELSDLICGVNRRLEQIVEVQLKPIGLSIEQYRVLKTLDAENGLTMGDLAVRVFVDSPTLTKIMDKMVASAHVYRGPDPRDRRRVLAFLSKKGKETFERIRASVVQAESGVCSELAKGREDQLKMILMQLLAGTEAGAGDGARQVAPHSAPKNGSLSLG